MNRKTSNNVVSAELWQQRSCGVNNEQAAEVFPGLFGYVMSGLAHRISETKSQADRVISFFTGGRESLTINVTRKDLLVCIRPKAARRFHPKARFDADRLRF